MAFEAGQFVGVKSGGPKMTVSAVDGDNVRCFWMELSGKSWTKREDTFPAVVLGAWVDRPIGAVAGSRRSVASFRGGF